jgi:outer membrane protein assembly factor BamB/protein involved in temperature-dependent protein secretion
MSRAGSETIHRHNGWNERLGAGVLLALLVRGILIAPALAQQPAALQTTDTSAEDDSQKDLTQRSLPLRSALHHDGSLEAPFDRLVAMYREAGSLSELVELYRQHTTEYPADANGATVLVRLLAAAGDVQSLPTARTMAELHQDHAYLQYLYFRALQRTRQPVALDVLERAIALSKIPHQKAAWTEILLTEAMASDRPQLVDKHLQEMAGQTTTAAEKLDVAQRMLKYTRPAAALAQLEEAARLDPAPELGVQIQMVAATAEIALDQPAQAAARLDHLLEKLAADYWNRAEIVRRRIALVTSEQQRNVLIDAASRRLAERPTDEMAAIELTQLLIGFERRREALAVLLESGRKIAASDQLEKLTLELIDRLHDEHARQAFLAERLKRFPDRADLLALEVKSLLLTGNRPAALERLDKLVELAPAQDRISLQLELARSLVRSNLSADATEIFQRVLKASPTRFDLRRELAELYVKIGNRTRARELFAGKLSGDVETEQVLDFIPFLINQEMFIEARHALLQAIKPDDPNIELRLLLADVERRTGNRTAAEKVLAETRPLADTVARYKLWIEAEATLHQEDETIGTFVAAEQERLLAGARTWDADYIERVLSLLEIAGREKSGVDLVRLASAYLEDERIPAAAETKIREQLVRSMDKATDQREALAQQLESLIDARPDEADEYRARLGLLYLANNEDHLAVPLLSEVRVLRIQDVALLGDLEKAYGRINQAPQLLAVLERLTVLDSTNKATWEAWLYYLAMVGREDRLRDSLRRLLAGVDGLVLEEPIKQLLVATLVDSLGRSVLTSLIDGRTATLSDALAQLANLERLATTSQQSIWLFWNRAFILNRLNRPRERDEAIAEMQRILADLAKTRSTADKAPAGSATGTTAKESTAEEPKADVAEFLLDEGDALWLRFPDGLALTMSNARRLLTSAPQASHWASADARTGPLPKLAVDWALELPADQPIERVLVGAKEKIFVVDALGTLYGIDAATGKTLWEATRVVQPGSGTITVHTNNTTTNESIDYRLAPPLASLVVDERNRLFFAHGDEVACVSGDTGQIIWRSTIPAPSTLGNLAKDQRAPTPVFLYQSQVIAYEPTRDMVAAFDPATGKVVWSYEIGDGQPLAENRLLHNLNTGASLDGDRLFVYGRRAGLVNLALREVEWTIEPERARKFPVRLDPTPTPNTTTSSPVTPYPGITSMATVGISSGPSYVSRARYPSTTTSTRHYVDYQRRTAPPLTAESTRQLTDTTLVGPAAMWSVSSLNGGPRFAVLQGNRLVLGANDRLSIMDTELPIAGRNVTFVGSYLGYINRVACFIRGNEFVGVDLTSGVRRSYRLDEITGGQQKARVQAMIDGPLLYLTGPQGVLCLNILAAKRAFYAPWPSEAQLDLDDPRLPREADGVDDGTMYLWNGTIVPLGGMARCVTPLGAVSAGRIYTTTTPWRLVAIRGASEP